MSNSPSPLSNAHPSAASLAAMLVMRVSFAVTAVMSIPDQRSTGLAERPLAVAAVAGAGEFGERTPGIRAVVQGILPWLVPLWMAAVLLIGLYRLGGWVVTRRMRRVGVSAAPEPWRERLGKLARRIGVSKPVELLESSLVEVPVVFGHLRPAILVPVGLLTGLPAGQVEAILLHELAHIRRHDYLVNLTQSAVESLLFYHPVVWWVSGLIRAERENCCDDVVVSIQGDVSGYAAALVRLEERRSAGHEPALAATGGILMRRIRRLLGRPEEPRSTATLIAPAALMLVGFALAAGAHQAGSAREMAKPFLKWLDEDVVYIITGREKTAFERLGTDAEREHFIEQFWRRRDPDPATPENEFKEKHYWRIAYANKRFPSSGIAGWRTDRGRIYILHGPPDEIESHPGIRELWMYRGFDGSGKDLLVRFVAPENTGDLRLAGEPELQDPVKQ